MRASKSGSENVDHTTPSRKGPQTGKLVSSNKILGHFGHQVLRLWAISTGGDHEPTLQATSTYPKKGLDFQLSERRQRRRLTQTLTPEPAERAPMTLIKLKGCLQDLPYLAFFPLEPRGHLTYPMQDWKLNVQKFSMDGR